MVDLTKMGYCAKDQTTEQDQRYSVANFSQEKKIPATRLSYIFFVTWVSLFNHLEIHIAL